MQESKNVVLREMSNRNREVFRTLVEAYLDAGLPVGSRTLARDISEKASPATIRNTMQDLEYLGLLASPHVSSGRIPTELGLRMFVDELLEVDRLAEEEIRRIESLAEASDEDIPKLLDRAGSVLSKLTRSASLVLAPKSEAPIKHVEFLPIATDKALVVLVMEDGSVENRMFKPPPGLTSSAMREAANFVNAYSKGRTISEFLTVINSEIEQRRFELDKLATELAERGIAVWEKGTAQDERLIVRGRSNLLDGKEIHEDLDRVRQLFDDLERKRDIADFLEFVHEGEGVRIFIGSENKLFSLTGSTLVISPYMNNDRKIIGAVGIIGPTRMNYGRVVPIVDYTAQLVGRMVSEI